MIQTKIKITIVAPVERVFEVYIVSDEFIKSVYETVNVEKLSESHSITTYKIRGRTFRFETNVLEVIPNKRYVGTSIDKFSNANYEVDFEQVGEKTIVTMSSSVTIKNWFRKLLTPIIARSIAERTKIKYVMVNRHINPKDVGTVEVVSNRCWNLDNRISLFLIYFFIFLGAFGLNQVFSAADEGSTDRVRCE